MVASTIVPVVIRIPLLSRYRFTVSSIWPHSSCSVLFQQMAEVKNGRLIRNRGAAQIDAGKAAQHRRFVQRIFHARVRKSEPLLQEIYPEHDVEPHRLTARLAL